MLQKAIPLIRIFDLDKASEFYIDWLGFYSDWSQSHDCAEGISVLIGSHDRDSQGSVPGYLIEINVVVQDGNVVENGVVGNQVIVRFANGNAFFAERSVQNSRADSGLNEIKQKH